jgi:hypothetical protein
MEQTRFDSYRYGLACLLVRRPHLRVYASTAHWSSDLIEEYGVAVRYRDKLRVEGNCQGATLAEYEDLSGD